MVIVYIPNTCLLWVVDTADYSNMYVCMCIYVYVEYYSSEYGTEPPPALQS